MPPSPLMVSLESHINNLQSDLIVARQSYNLYTRQDHTQANAFTLLASAMIEDFVEKRCEQISKLGLKRLENHLPSSTGKALVIWHFTRDGKKTKNQLPVQTSDLATDRSLTSEILEKYLNLIEKNHGVGGDKIRNLVFPLGVRENQIPEILVNKLDELADYRNTLAHTVINRARSFMDPAVEVTRVNQAVIPLKQLDLDLQYVAENFPVP